MCEASSQPGLLGGSKVVVSRVISRVTILITHIRGLITSLITTHEPPSIVFRLLSRGLSFGCIAADTIWVTETSQDPTRLRFPNAIVAMLAMLMTMTIQFLKIRIAVGAAMMMSCLAFTKY